LVRSVKVYIYLLNIDFLNYLNHTYIFDETVFYDDKLNRTTTNIPIIAYMPEKSGLCE